ncbi:unnamed protein product [Caenorhabditis angaria]|uniref:Cyclin-like domain-containing protein n=1 Tax=Caenorhabditis angaria TaxID=860376 RepID=A0A9P1I475_9PELO|nr:unnamed protein product [Caenorhabditis angaria]
MAGRKSTKNRQISETTVKNPNQPKTSAEESLIISPNGELRRRLLEAAIDVKENIPSETIHNRRITRSCASSMDSEKAPFSPETRKRRGAQIGPIAKRASIEKKDQHPSTAASDDDTFSNSSGSISSISTSSSTSSKNNTRLRGKPLPVMEEEDSDIENEEEEEQVRDILEVEVDDEEEFEDEELEDEELDEADLPLENEQFAIMKSRMNDVTLLKPPSSLNPEKLRGIGSPEQVWSLMVGRDEISRASNCLLNNHPEMSENMRGLLIDWLMEVCESENLHRETFHLSIDYIDRYLDSNDRPVNQNTFQLVGAAALFVAAKYEEIYPPRCEEFANLTDGAFSCENIRQMEVLLVRAINWTLGPITSIHWLATYLQLLGQEPEKQSDDEHFTEQNNYFVPELMREDFVHMARILDYLLFEADSLRFTYRTIAAAVLFACVEPREEVENATGFLYDQLSAVIRFVEPVVTVFDRSRDAGDPLPTNEKITPEDVHNIQTYFKFDEIRPKVDEERRLRKMSSKNL